MSKQSVRREPPFKILMVLRLGREIIFTKEMERNAALAPALRDRHHNFRHFSSFLSALHFG